MTFKFSLLIAILGAIATLAAPAAAQSDRPGAKKSKAISTSPPMIFYLAKGEDDVCGQGCNEWIAAEGQIDAAAAQRLRTFLTRVGKRKLPIFFHSPGGNGTTSTVMGRLLREREMTAGVYETIPAGCMGASEQACRALKQSGQVLPSALRNMGSCNSACVFALIGAKVRHVPPGARVGIHSAKVVVPWTEARNAGYSSKQIVSFQKTKLAELNAQFRRYVQEMKIDVRLFDLSSKIPHENIHYLSRDEIVRFGIDTRESQEARWMAMESPQKQLWTMKYFVEPKGASRKELRTSVIQVGCAGPQRVGIAYIRGLASDENGPKGEVKLAVGDRGVSFSGPGSVLTLDTIEAGVSFSVLSTYAAFELLEGAAARDHIEIVEADAAGAPSRITKLSTAGLPQAVTALRGRCGSTPDCPQAGSWIAGAQFPGWTAGAMSPSSITGAVPSNPGASSPSWTAGAHPLNCAVPFTNPR